MVLKVGILRLTCFALVFIVLLCLNAPFDVVCYCWPRDLGWVRLGFVNLKLYIVEVDGVGGLGAKPYNSCLTTEGALDAAGTVSAFYPGRPNNGIWWMDYIDGGVLHYQLNVTVEASVIRDWQSYREIVEEGKNVIVLNSHGQIIPVPRGYSPEEWVDRIADAMLNRNVTWVHTAWYPFSAYHIEGESEHHLWGGEGFRHLMKHIGIQNATCTPPGSESVLISLNPYTQVYFADSWPSIQGYAAYVQAGRPLNASQFKEFIVSSPIWGTMDAYLTGGIIKFARNFNASGSFGFYVHIGTNETFNVSEEPTGGDYWRGYVGAAAAIWANALRIMGEEKIREASTAIKEAEAEGRTKGLDESIRLLNEALEELYEKHLYIAAIIDAVKAKEAAENAVQPSLIEKYGGQIMTTAILCITITMTWLWRRRNKKREQRYA
jgi:hypothetical protein